MPAMRHLNVEASEVVRGVVPRNDSLVADESPLSELLNVAWASHEITSQYGGHILDFCESHRVSGDEL